MIPDFVREEIDRAKAWKKRIELKHTYASVFGTDGGKEVLHDILRFSGFASNGMDANPHYTAYNEGRRAVALHILSRRRMDNAEAVEQLMEDSYER